ncbi:MAG: ribosomal protein S18-alanine N-acetyltransferase [Oscillospiraceae bacterium]|nr:ribosomal protein S18-alanine N-acetyltransferase [Oscillospiraceae bacterium]
MTDIINIVPMSKEHIVQIAKIESESFADPWAGQIFYEVLQVPDCAAFVALKSESVAGYLILRRTPPEIEILNIAVKESERKKNIATNLFSALFEYANLEKAEKLTLEVRRSNGPALALYKKLGFEIDGYRKNYYENPKEDAILMSLKLKTGKI